MSLAPTPAAGAAEVVTRAAYQKKDGRTVMLGEMAAGELVLLAERTPGATDWQLAHGPFALPDLVAHADACLVGDQKALTDPVGHRALAMAVVHLMTIFNTAQAAAAAPAQGEE
jgi:hypothetical protein